MLLFVPIPKLLAVNKATLSVCKCAAATYFGTLLAEKELPLFLCKIGNKHVITGM